MGNRRRYEPDRRCNARARSGGRCQKPAGWGTDHVGWGVCRLHGGSTRTARVGAHRQAVLAEMPTMGGELEIAAIDALQLCVGREAGRSAFLRTMVEAIDPDGARQLSDPGSEVAQLAHLEAQSTERLARFSKMAIDAGVDERRVRLVERQAQALAHAFTTALDQHPLGAEMTTSQRAELVRLFAAQLALLESGAGDVEGQAREVGPHGRPIRRAGHDAP